MPIQWLDAGGEEREVGKKAAALATAADAGLTVPRGFVVTAPTFEQFVREHGLEERIQRILNGTDPADIESVRQAENRIRSLLEGEDVSDEIRQDIEEAYQKISMSEEVRTAGEDAVDLVGGQREMEFVAVRSSPTGARIPGAHSTELNVNGKDAVIAAVKDCWASLYSAEALSMEDHVGDIHSIAVIVQRMVEPDVSGSAYSSNPVNGKERLIESVWGMGTALSSGTTTPDRYLVDERGDVTEEEIANKGWKIVRDPTSGKTMKQRVPGNERRAGTLEERKAADVADAVRTAEGAVGGNVRIDFALGRNGVHILDVERFTSSGGQGQEAEGVVRGRGAAGGKASGTVNIIYTDTDIESVQEDEIIASSEASERIIPLLRRVSGVVSDEGGISSNLSCLARALDVPCVVGTSNATDMLTKGETITVNGATGTVFEGVREQQSPATDTDTAGRDLLTATTVKTLNGIHPGADGAIMPDYTDPRQAEEIARQHHPETVWIRTERREYAPDNLGIISERAGAADSGVVLASYGTVMRTSNLLNDGVSFLGVDVGALEQDGGRDALLNAVEKVGAEADQAETAVLLQQVDHICIQKAVESGIDTVAVPEHAVDAAREAVAKAERKFILARLREL